MKIHIAIVKEESYWIARCVEFMITDTGVSKEAAIKNLKRTMLSISKEHELKKLPLQKNIFDDWEIVQEEIELEIS